MAYRNENDDDNNDNDVDFQDKPICRKRIKASVPVNKKKRLKLSRPERPISTSNAPAPVKAVSPNMSAPSDVGRCPVCRFQLKYLLDMTAQRHVNECLDAGCSGESGLCPDGSDCDITNANHFKLYQHTSNSEVYGNGVKIELTSAHSTSNLTAESSLPYTSCDQSSNLKIRNHVEPGVPSCHSFPGSVEKTNRPMCKDVSTQHNSAGKVKVQTDIGSFFVVKSSNKKPASKKTEGSLGEKESLVSKPIQVVKNNSVVKNKQRSAGKPVESKRATDMPMSSAAVRKVLPLRPCPFYKKIPGTGISVDAFLYGNIPGCTAYLLSHFHYDHYRGLSNSFKGTVYCSKVTANLVISRVRVDSNNVVALPMHEWCTVAGVKMMLLDANHCPGSVLFLMELSSGRRILHTGDFRADDVLERYPILSEKPIESIYLDTTYCNPAYAFASQADVIDYVIETCKRALVSSPKTLFCCGSYTIGKERVFQAIAKQFDFKIGVTSTKKQILSCIECDDLNSRMTLNLSSAQVHVVDMKVLTFKSLLEHLKATQKKANYEKLVAFKPTGWTHSGRLQTLDNIKPRVSGPISIYDVPYSEHSSYSELEHFIRTLKPKTVIPTVNVGNPTERNKMKMLFDEWSS